VVGSDMQPLGEAYSLHVQPILDENRMLQPPLPGMAVPQVIAHSYPGLGVADTLTTLAQQQQAQIAMLQAQITQLQLQQQQQQLEQQQLQLEQQKLLVEQQLKQQQQHLVQLDQQQQLEQQLVQQHLLHMHTEIAPQLQPQLQLDTLCTITTESNATLAALH
jgi:hypothetical protein